jgi:uncharacterized protein
VHSEGAVSRVVTRFLLALLSFALPVGPLSAQPVIPFHATLVMDTANVISPEKEQFLAGGLVGFRQTQEREVSVITVPDLQGFDIDAYTRRLAVEWGLEDSRNDDGAVLVVAPRELRVGIAVGSAVKSRLPDDVAREIIEALVLPSFERGDMDTGVLNGAGSMLYYLELTPQEAAAVAERQRLELAQVEEDEDEGVPWGGLIVLLLILLLWPILRILLAPLGLLMGAVSVFGRGSGGGFGGFGGGGSGFNGGGASGRW